MSKYTTEVRYICEVAAGLDSSEGYNSIDSILDAAIDPTNPKNIFNFNFPIYDEAYRGPLEKKILRHYYTREICEETVGLWKLRLEDRLNTIMPYYNQLYESALLKFNPLWDIELSETHAGNADKEESGDSSVSDVFSEDGKRKVEYNKSQSDSESAVESATKNKDYSATSGESEKNTGSVNRNLTNNENGSTENNRIQSNQKSVSESGTRTGVEANTQKSKGKENANEHGSDITDILDKYADTPQGTVENLLNDTYLTNATAVNNTNVNISTSDTNNEQEQEGQRSSSSDYENKSSESTTNAESDSQKHSKTAVKAETGSNSGSRDKTEYDKANTRDEENRNAVTAKDVKWSGDDTETKNNTAVRGVTGKKKNKYNSTDSYINAVAGKRGPFSYSRMLIEFRDTFINIDEMIINNLSDLFFGLW